MKEPCLSGGRLCEKNEFKIKIYDFFCTFAVDYKEKRDPFPL